MSRKRKRSEPKMSASMTQPRSRTMLREALVKLNQDAELDLPYESCTSSKSSTSMRHKVSQCYAELFLHDEILLGKAVTEFLNGINSLTSAESRYKRLLAILESYRSDNGTEALTDQQAYSDGEEELFQDMAGFETRSTGRDISSFFKSSKSGLHSAISPPSVQTAPAKYGEKGRIPNNISAPFGVLRPPVLAPIFTEHIKRILMTEIAGAERNHKTQQPARNEHSATNAGTACSSHYSPLMTITHLGHDSDTVVHEDNVAETSSDEDFPSPAKSEEDAWLTNCLDIEASQKVSDTRYNAATDLKAGLLNVIPDSSGLEPSTSDTPRHLGQVPKTEETEIRNPWTVLSSNHSILACIPEQLQDSPFEVQYELQRILQNNLLTSEQLLQEHYDKTLLSLYDMMKQTKPSFTPSFPLDALDSKGEFNRDNHTLRAELQRTEETVGPFFKLKALSPRKKRSSALQRRFGCGRILYVDLKFPGHYVSRSDLDFLRRWFSKPQLFLGRSWNLYNVNVKSIRQKSLPDCPPSLTFKAVFFSGDQDEFVLEVLGWALPVLENGSQAACKAYSRLDLQVSSSIPFTTFEDSEIDFNAPNILANGDPEDDQFTDPELANHYTEQLNQAPRVMNDGCAYISFKQRLLFQKQYGLEKTPTVLQGRIAGAKGVWAGLPGSLESTHPGREIQVNESQIKVKRKTLAGSEPSIRTFNVKSYDRPARAAPLYPDFIPILEHRGVPKTAILDLVRNQIQQEGRTYLNALKSGGTMLLRDWMASRAGRFESVRRDYGIDRLAGFPTSTEEKVIQMLEAGFEHKTNHYLWHLIRGLSTRYFERWTSKAKIELPRATSLIGIVDPSGVVRPGEIHVMFSKPFKDTTGTTWQILDDTNALIARNPAKAPWDIQKVRIIFRMELKDLTDAVIFSSQGQRPLAGELQGGDYDGDTFWICWEPSLVESFRNAPAPSGAPAPEEFGIVTDNSKLSEHMTDPNSPRQHRQWLGRMAANRMENDILGRISRLHERVTYDQGAIDTGVAITLVHLHGHMIDADKQGYSLPERAFEKLKQKLGIQHQLPEPLYREYIEAKAGEKEDVIARRKPRGTVDELYINVIDPEVRKILQEADKIVMRPHRTDEDLTKFYRQTMATTAPGSSVHRQSLELKEKLLDLKASWNKLSGSWADRPGGWDEMILDLRSKYDAIQPGRDSIVVGEWLRKQGHDMSTWDKFKASAFADLLWDTRTPGSLVMNVAGSEMCHLKAHEIGPSRVMTYEYYRAQRFRMPRGNHAETSEESEEEEDSEL